MLTASDWLMIGRQIRQTRAAAARLRGALTVPLSAASPSIGRLVRIKRAIGVGLSASFSLAPNLADLDRPPFGDHPEFHLGDEARTLDWFVESRNHSKKLRRFTTVEFQSVEREMVTIAHNLLDLAEVFAEVDSRIANHWRNVAEMFAEFRSSLKVELKLAPVEPKPRPRPKRAKSKPRPRVSA